MAAGWGVDSTVSGGDAVGVVARDQPGDGAAPVVTDEVDALAARRIDAARGRRRRARSRR